MKHEASLLQQTQDERFAIFGTNLACSLEPLFAHIDDDDAPCACQAGDLDGIQAEPTDAEDGD
jgi:hypothetical protein